MKPLIYITGTSPISREETIQTHASYVSELSRLGLVAVSPILYLQHAAVDGAWRRFAEALIPRCSEMHVLLNGGLIAPVKRDIEIAGNRKLQIRYIPCSTKSPTSGSSISLTSNEEPCESSTRAATP
jgi:hypothetical protein